MASVVILVSPNALDLHMDMSPSNAHFLHLGGFWKIRHLSRVHIVEVRYQKGHFFLHLPGGIPSSARAANNLLQPHLKPPLLIATANLHLMCVERVMEALYPLPIDRVDVWLQLQLRCLVAHVGSSIRGVQFRGWVGRGRGAGKSVNSTSESRHEHSISVFGPELLLL
jgi:hypothetical protein